MFLELYSVGLRVSMLFSRVITTIMKMSWCLSIMQSRKHYWVDLTEILYSADLYSILNSKTTVHIFHLFKMATFFMMVVPYKVLTIVYIFNPINKNQYITD